MRISHGPTGLGATEHSTTSDLGNGRIGQRRFSSINGHSVPARHGRDLGQKRVHALFASGDGFFLTHSDRIVALASRHAVPATYGWRQAVALGGLMSYATNFPDAWGQARVYTGRILKGEKPSDLPVQ